MDINLKGDINGIQAAEKILALDLAVIYLTANSDDMTFNDALNQSPASAFISKPYNINTLSKNVALAINRQSVESEKVNEARGISKDENKNSDVLSGITYYKEPIYVKFGKFNSRIWIFSEVYIKRGSSAHKSNTYFVFSEFPFVNPVLIGFLINVNPIISAIGFKLI